MFLCKLLSLQESGQLDQRTSTAVESLLSLSNPSASEEMQWRPPSPASSISTESATFSPSRPDSVESASADCIEIDQCDSPSIAADVPQSPGAMVSVYDIVPYTPKPCFFRVSQKLCLHASCTHVNTPNVQDTLARHADTPINYPFARFPLFLISQFCVTNCNNSPFMLVTALPYSCVKGISPLPGHSLEPQALHNVLTHPWTYPVPPPTHPCPY